MYGSEKVNVGMLAGDTSLVKVSCKYVHYLVSNPAYQLTDTQLNTQDASTQNNNNTAPIPGQCWIHSPDIKTLLNIDLFSCN